MKFFVLVSVLSLTAVVGGRFGGRSMAALGAAVMSPVVTLSLFQVAAMDPALASALDALVSAPRGESVVLVIMVLFAIVIARLLLDLATLIWTLARSLARPHGTHRLGRAVLRREHSRG